MICALCKSVMDPKITLPSDDWTLKSEAKSYIKEYDSFPRSDFASMHPKISLLSDDSILKSTATSKRMEVVVNELASIGMDEDLNDIIKKISKIVFDEVPDVDMDEDLNNLVNTMRKCTLMSSCATKKDSMLSEGYKSEITKIIEGYSTKDVPWEQDAQSSRMTRIDEEDAQNRRINFKKFVNHSDHLSSTCTSPMKKASASAVIDEITDVEKDATLIDSVNKKRKENITKVGKYSLKDVMFDPYDARNSPTERIYDGDVVKRYENFKKFDIVLDHSDYLFSGCTPVSQLHTEWAKMIHEDWRTLEENLPGIGDSVSYGLFFFDLHFQTAYPLGPPNFEAFVVGHFRNRVRDILLACKAYIEGVQVGRVVSGEGNENRTLTFRYDVTRCIKPLIAAFIKIGSSEAQEFLYLSEKRIIAASAPTPVTKSITMKATQSRLTSTGALCN
uniref:Uncharacterized protein n=1 Tax=Tanacetum cinerariifolium TaxID=118510 RepID=A0A699GZ75_TANCI|nr:hypothetical protein [Tanacetum cinerariifolium]